MPQVYKLPSFLRKRIINGKYYGPLISAQRLSKIRKNILRNGLIWPFEQPMPHLKRNDFLSNKKEKSLQKKQKKEEKIKAAMEQMPKEVEKYKKELKEKRKTRRISFIKLVNKEYPETKLKGKRKK